MQKNKVGFTLGSIALVMSVAAFIFGSAAFAPALFLVLCAIPLALVVALLGSWRLSLISVYFGFAAWFVVPLSRQLHFRLDYLLVLLAILGVIIAAGLFYGYKQS